MAVAPPDVLSPELALVDPELAARARRALDLSTTGANRGAPALRPVGSLVVLTPDPQPRHAATFVALLVVVVCSHLGTSWLGNSRDVAATSVAAQADGSTQRHARQASPSPHRPGPAAKPAPSATRQASPSPHRTRPAAGPAPSGSSDRAKVPPVRPAPPGRALVPRASAGRTLTRPVGSARNLPRALRKTELVWAQASAASAYQVALVRGDKRIYSAMTRTAHIVIPRQWARGSRTYRLQPEDELYVWAVVGGRRGRTVVDGAPALDSTAVATAAGLYAGRG